MKDIELQTEAFKRYIEECDELSITPDYASAFNAAWTARAAIEADRAQRVPDDDHEPMLYVASRASLPARPQMWQSLRSAGWPIISTWIDEAGEGETEDMGMLWFRIHQEIRRSVGVLLYAEAEDFPLKGALIECGIALGMGKPVALVLPGVKLDGRSMKPIGSWVAHPLVTIYQTLDQAKDALLASTPAPAQQEPATPMDAHRAAYFMRRFLHEEKMLGPNEQAALHFTITALEAMESAAQHQEQPQQERGPMTDAARDVLAERQRQISTEGWTLEHDDEHTDGSLSVAAACYALTNVQCARPGALSTTYLATWVGWGGGWFKPTYNRRRDLVKAGALILAEIERLDRAERHHGIKE